MESSRNFEQVLESLFNKVAALPTCNFIKKRLQYRCFPSEIYKILKNTYFVEHLRTIASKSAFILPKKIFCYSKNFCLIRTRIFSLSDETFRSVNILLMRFRILHGKYLNFSRLSYATIN